MKFCEAFANWESEIKPIVIAQYCADDMPALSESWNDYTDSLCKDGDLSTLQYHYCPAWDDAMPEDDYEYIVEQMGIAFHSRRIPTRPDAGEWDAGASHWRVTITRNKKRMCVTYSMGGAHIGEPQGADVLYSILSDHDSAAECSFSEWCAEYGYDTDSLKASRMYRACKRISASLARLFTASELADLSELFEGY